MWGYPTKKQPENERAFEAGPFSGETQKGRGYRFWPKRPPILRAKASTRQRWLASRAMFQK